MAFYRYDAFTKRRLEDHFFESLQSTVPSVGCLLTMRLSFFDPLPINRQLQYWMISIASIALSTILPATVHLYTTALGDILRRSQQLAGENANFHNGTGQHSLDHVRLEIPECSVSSQIPTIYDNLILLSFIIGAAIGYLFFRPKISKYSVTGGVTFLLSTFVSRTIADWVLRYFSIRFPTNHTWLSIGVGYIIVSELDWLFGTVYCLQEVEEEFRGHQRGGLCANFHTWLNVCAAALIHLSFVHIALGLFWVLYKRPWLQEGRVDIVQTAMVYFADQVFFVATFPPKWHVMDWLFRRFLKSDKEFGRDARQAWEIT
jgi:hypothetical protein